MLYQPTAGRVNCQGTGGIEDHGGHWRGDCEPWRALRVLGALRTMEGIQRTGEGLAALRTLGAGVGTEGHGGDWWH